jgi:hypothetical protein
MVRSSDYVLPGLLDNIHPHRHDHLGCFRRVADPCVAPAPGASPACLFEPAARAVWQSMIAAPVAEVRKPLPPISGNLATGFAASSRNPPAISPKRVLSMQLMCRLDPVGPPAHGSVPTEGGRRRDRRSRTEKMKPYLMLLFIGWIMMLSDAVGPARQSSRLRVLDIIRNTRLFRRFL